MKIATTFRPHLGGSYEQISRGVSEAERLGFETLFVPDHLISTPDFHREGAEDSDAAPPVRDDELERGTGPTDVWMILAGLARDTSTIRLGTLVTNNSFRYPSMMAVSVSVANEMSGGRIDFGVGAGWFATEHSMYGIPFPSLKERFDRLEDLFEIIHGLWGSDGPFTYHGKHVSVSDALSVSAPDGLRRARLMTGGKGLVRTPSIAARYTDEVNAATDDIDVAMTFFRACDEACERIGRDPATLTRSVSFRIQCGEDEADLRHKTAALGTTLEETRQVHFAGTPDELIERLSPFDDAGVDRVILARRMPVDVPGLRLLGETVVPRFHVAPSRSESANTAP